MFNETSYPYAAGLGDLGGKAKAAGGISTSVPAPVTPPLWQQQGYPSRAAWQAAGKPGKSPTLTIPTTEPPPPSSPGWTQPGTACPPGMTYQGTTDPTTGGVTMTCKGPLVLGDGSSGGSGTGTSGASSSGSSITDLLSSIPPTYLLIGGAIILLMVLKK
jgi:hypothetical protein